MNIGLNAMAIAAATLISATAVSAEDKTAPAHTEVGQCHIRVYFGLDLDQVNPEVRADLDNLIRKYPDAQIEATGYTDALSSVAYNESLSKRRVMHVVQYLQTHGGNKMTFKTNWLGKTALVVPVAGAEPKNRFVDLKIANCDPAVLMGTATPVAGPVGSLTDGAAVAGVGLVGLMFLLGNHSTNGTTSTTSTVAAPVD